MFYDENPAKLHCYFCIEILAGHASRCLTLPQRMTLRCARQAGSSGFLLRSSHGPQKEIRLC